MYKRQVKKVFDRVEGLIEEGCVNAAFALTSGGVSEALVKMALGNSIGVKLQKEIDSTLLFNGVPGGFVLELVGDYHGEDLEIIGVTTSKYILVFPDFTSIRLYDLQEEMCIRDRRGPN